MISRLCFVFFVFCAASPTLAEPTQPVVDLVLEGRWTFQTQTFEQRDCTMSGDLTVTTTGHPLIFDGVLIARETCKHADYVITAEQTSVVKHINNAVIVRSEVKTVNPPVPYRPDHFRLKVIDGNTLRGVLDANVDAEVVFTRVTD